MELANAKDMVAEDDVRPFGGELCDPNLRACGGEFGYVDSKHFDRD